MNDRCLRNTRTGVGHYVAELLAELPQVDCGLQILPFYQAYLGGARAGTHNAPRRDSHGEFTAPLEPEAVLNRRRWPDWLRRLMQGCYELGFEALGSLQGYRLYHEPNHIPGPWQGPIITTIHDLSVLRHPEWHPTDRVRWYERAFVPSLTRSEHFITVSEFTRQEMIDHLHVAPERITAIHLGVRSVFRPRAREAVLAWLTQRKLPAEYLLFVGTVEPRKNLDGLLAAYGLLPGALRKRVSLLLVGTGGWGNERLQDLTARYGVTDAVRPLGYVNDEDLSWLYAGATALAWPSWYEGFGLPVLESMACGTPVITSRAASLPEVVGEAGLLVDPGDASELARAMQSVIEDAALKARLTACGLERSELFSWRSCAAQHACIYRRFAGA